MKRANPSTPGRRCAFCKQIGGTGFVQRIVEELGGEPGNRYAHSDCMSNAQRRHKKGSQSRG